MSAVLDQYVQRLRAIDPVSVPGFDDVGNIVPEKAILVDGNVVGDLIIYDSTIADAVSVVAGQIMWWGRVAARAQRVWHHKDREATQWKAKKFLEMAVSEGKPDGWKKPTEKVIEASYRADDQYTILYREVEAAEEAYNVCRLIVDAFKAKRDMLKADVYRAHDGSVQRMSV